MIETSGVKRILVIGASLGGYRALKMVLKELPHDYPIAITVVISSLLDSQVVVEWAG